MPTTNFQYFNFQISTEIKSAFIRILWSPNKGIINNKVILIIF